MEIKTIFEWLKSQGTTAVLLGAYIWFMNGKHKALEEKNEKKYIDLVNELKEKNKEQSLYFISEIQSMKKELLDCQKSQVEYLLNNKKR
jgi:hypothetical protein